MNKPAKGLLRLTWPQVELIQAQYAKLWSFVANNLDSEARLVLVIKRGKTRFIELETSASELNQNGQKILPWTTIQVIDAKLSSLCGLTEETGGEARLVLSIGHQGEIQMKMVVSQELCPTR